MERTGKDGGPLPAGGCVGCGYSLWESAAVPTTSAARNPLSKLGDTIRPPTRPRCEERTTVKSFTRAGPGAMITCKQALDSIR